MEEFAAQQRGPNGNEPAPLPPGFDKRPLAGWNSWAGAADHLFQPNVSNMIATSDVLAKGSPLTDSLPRWSCAMPSTI